MAILYDGVSQFPFVVLSEINYINEKVIRIQTKRGISECSMLHSYREAEH